MQIPTPNGAIRGYLAVPNAGSGPWPGIVIVHDIFGTNDDIRSITDRFAANGYLAVLPSLYSSGLQPLCVIKIFAQLRAGKGRAFDDLAAARQLLLDRPDCSGTIGMVGFCLGGSFALLAAQTDYAASAPYYGKLMADPAVLEGACPMVASYGGKDWMIRQTERERIRTALAKYGDKHEFKVYPDATHGFANRVPGARVWEFLRVRYDHAAAEDAWQRVLTFFGSHLH
jgi:carboxymethylenebutenolidase